MYIILKRRQAEAAWSKPGQHFSCRSKRKWGVEERVRGQIRGDGTEGTEPYKTEEDTQDEEEEEKQKGKNGGEWEKPVEDGN